MLTNWTVLIQIILTLLILIVMVYKRIKYKITPLNYPILVVLFAHLRADVDFLFNSERDFFDFSANFHFVFYGLTVYVLYLFGESIITTKYQAWRKHVVTVVFGIFLGMYLSALVFQDYVSSLAGTCEGGPVDGLNGCNPASWPFVGFIPFYELSLDVFQTMVFVFMTYIYIVAYRKTSSEGKRKQILLLIVSMILFLSVGLIELGEHFLGYEINAWISSIAAFSILSIVYIIYYRIAYIAAVNVYRLSVVIRSSGIAIFTQEFIRREMFEIALLASLSMTLNETFQEITSSKGNIRSIDIDTSSVVMCHSDKIFSILEAEHAPTILKNALSDFTTAFEEEYSDFIDNFQGEIVQLPNIHEFITRYFPNA